MTIELPRERKGFTVTSIRWDRDGKVREAIYEPIPKARPALKTADHPKVRRGAMQGSLL